MNTPGPAAHLARPAGRRRVLPYVPLGYHCLPAVETSASLAESPRDVNRPLSLSSPIEVGPYPWGLPWEPYLPLTSPAMPRGPGCPQGLLSRRAGARTIGATGTRVGHSGVSGGGHRESHRSSRNHVPRAWLHPVGGRLRCRHSGGRAHVPLDQVRPTHRHGKGKGCVQYDFMNPAKGGLVERSPGSRGGSVSDVRASTRQAGAGPAPPRAHRAAGGPGGHARRGLRRGP